MPQDNKEEIQAMFDTYNDSLDNLSQKIEEYKQVSEKEPQAIKDHRKIIKELQQEIKEVEKQIPDLSNILSQLKKLQEKTNDTTQYTKLSTSISLLEKTLQDKATFDEVKTALKEFHTKDEVKENYYNKKEINNKLKNIKWWDTTVLKWNTSRWSITWTLSDQTDLQNALVLTDYYTKPETDNLLMYFKYWAWSPEWVITAPVGTIYSRTDWWAGTSFYVKESGTWNTWRVALWTKSRLEALQYQSYTFTKVDNKVDTITYADWTITEFTYVDNVLTTSVTTFTDATVITVTYTENSVTYS